MRVGKFGLLHFIILSLVKTLFSPNDGVEAQDKTIYAVGINCVPGTFVTNNGCQKCDNGTFSEKHNATKCSLCDRCFGKHNEVVKPCTSYSNTNCSCQPGYYYDAPLAFCMKCTQCKKGRGVVRSCTARGNTQCNLCVKGQTFSDRKNMERCQPCRRCPKGQIVEKNCTRRTNTVCVVESRINKSKPKPVSPGAMATRPPVKNRTTTTTKKKRWKITTRRVSTEPVTAQNHSLTPVSISDEVTDTDEDAVLQTALYALIAVVVVLVIVFVLVCWYKRKDRPKKKPKPGGEEPSTRSNSTDVIEAVENPYSSLPFISAPRGQEKMLRDVPYTLISDLAFHLNPGERWKQLGGQLKFNSTQVNTFSLEKGNATQAMLQEWGQRDGATVVALQNTFRKMKWTKEEKMAGKYV